MTESTKRRALNVFAAMGTIPDAYVTAAEDALYEAEAGIRRPQKPIGPVRRFLNSGWGAAVISGIVALTVLFLIIRAGQNPPTYPPPTPPAGSSIPMSDEGADFTISTEEDYYRANTNRITVIMTGVTPGQSISMLNDWYLEWLTDEGAKAVEIYYTEEATISAKPARGEYATIHKAIHINDAKGYALQPGTYRLHATVYNGEEYVSVAWCEFEVGEPEMETTIVCDGAVFHYDPYAVAVPFTVTTDAKIPFGTGRIRLTVTAEEPMVSLFEQPIYWHIQREDGYVHTPVGSWAVTDTSPETYIQTGPTEEDVYARHTVGITLPVLLDEWEPGTYRVYALTEPLSENNVYAASCTFTILEDGETMYPEVTEDASEITIKTRSPSYPAGTNNFSVILTASDAERIASEVDGWYLEKLTAEGKVKIGSPYVNTAFESVGDETSVKIPLGVPLTLDSGLYGLHAFKKSGNENISLAYCTFTIDEEPLLLTMRFSPPVPSGEPYTISVPDIPYGSESLTITVTASEPGVPLIDPPLHWFIGKNSASHWPYDEDLDPWDASVTRIKEVRPSESSDGYAQFTVTLTFRYPPEWTEGEYYLYAMTEPLQENNRLIDSCTFRVTAPAE